MLNYYTIITLITIAALGVLCVLVHDNSRISKKQKLIFYITYLLIGLAASAEWIGIKLSGNTAVPSWLLLAVKCTDYILTPLAGGAFVRQLELRNRGFTLLNAVLIGNTVFQIIAVFFGWMVTIDGNGNYYHGPLYFVYIIIYLFAIAIVIIEFLKYGKCFQKQNRYSLYSVMTLVLSGILIQEILGKDYRTAYFSMAFGALMLYIHYLEYVHIDDEDHINKQRELLNKDSLTGIFSRYAYSKALKEYNAQGSLPSDFAAFSIDINGLKTANDTLGHAAGDELICGAAKCIQTVFESHGLCYRTGGDEFIVLAKADRILAEALVYQLEDEAAAWDGKLIHTLSLSIGYALASDHEGVSAEKLIIFADEEMYAEKKLFYQNPENNRRAFSDVNP
ncbi:MAG: GGDEF domain-containing protein [Ruminococcus sp.]|nr:GGDEF domain-containing protein [Ruminococcus sp.]